MTHPDPGTITQLLRDAREGQAGASSSLLPFVYAELGELAARLFSSERRGHTLQPTALVHEAWVKLAGHLDGVEDRIHFFAIASQAMRQVLIDHARGKSRLKRGGDNKQVTLSGLGAETPGDIDLVDLSDSLARLSELNERHARVVELRVLGGLSILEVGDFLGVSHATVERDWLMAKAWLRTELAPDR